MSICLIDTSIFCEVVGIPHMADNRAAILSAMKGKKTAGESLLLPMATILETGNHIGQNGDGRQRRTAALEFARIVIEAVEGKAPFVPSNFFSAEKLSLWLAEFPDWTMKGDAKGKGSGLGDMTIKKEWDRQRELHPSRRVYIWSMDIQLQSYDTGDR